MAKFIEVHRQGTPLLVNLGQVEDIWPEKNGARIYFAFTVPGGIEQDYLATDEGYDELRRLILGGAESATD